MKIKICYLFFVVCYLLAGSSVSFAAPIISNEELVSIADNQMVITWQTTNEAANSNIKWGYSLPVTNSFTTDEAAGQTQYHYLTLNNLFPNTIYYYKISSQSTSGTTEGIVHSFRTLERPSGNYLFTFATITDLHFAPNLDNTSNVRGRPYASSEAIITALVSAINQHSPAFTIIKGDMLDAAVDSPPLTRTNQLKGILDSLNNDPARLKYYPIPGNHDKAITTYTGNWVSDNLGILCTPESSLPVGDSTFNYSFVHDNYRFIMLDSLKNDGITAEANIATLEAELAAAQTAKQKAFVFMHNEVSEEADIPDEILSAVLDSGGGTVDQNRIRLSNKTDFFNTLNAHQLTNGDPVVASVLMGHIHDNRRRDFYGIPCVRTSSGLQYPTAYTIYKVYSNGYIQTFYKLPGFSEELSRSLIIGTNEVTAARAQQFYLGASSSRNFMFPYSAIGTVTPPTVEAIQPAPGSQDIARNQPLIISFTKPMSEEGFSSWFQLTLNGAPVTFNSTWDTTKTVLTVTATLTASTTYDATITTGATATDLTHFMANYTFSFRTGTDSSSTSPSVTINRLQSDQGLNSDVTTDITPTFTGIATDTSGSTVSNVEFRFDTSSTTWSNWLAATPLSGAFRSSQEVFTFTITTEVLRGEHQVQVRASNAAGITSSPPYSSYTYWFINDKPEITLKSNGTNIENGDPISATPSLEIKVVSDVPLNQLWLTIDATRTPLTFTSTFINTVNCQPTLSPTVPHTIRVEAIGIDATNTLHTATKEANNLMVQTSGDPHILGSPLNYPNPFDPSLPQNTTISYLLSKDTDITLKIFDISGNLLATQNLLAGQSGGTTGYNEIIWDGRSNGNFVGNGIYVYFLINNGKVLQNGIGKITVFKQ